MKKFGIIRNGAKEMLHFWNSQKHISVSDDFQNVAFLLLIGIYIHFYIYVYMMFTVHCQLRLSLHIKKMRQFHENQTICAFIQPTPICKRPYYSELQKFIISYTHLLITRGCLTDILSLSY